MDVQTILLGVEERDKWRNRLEVLRGALAEVRNRRQRLERQLRSLKRQLSHLADLTEATIDPRRLRPMNSGHGFQEGRILH